MPQQKLNLTLQAFFEKNHLIKMSSRYIKIAIAALILALAVYQFVEGNIGNGIFLVLLTGVPIFFFFINARNLLAMWFIRQQNFARASKILESVKHPDHMRKPQEAYHYLLKGMIASQTPGGGKAEHLLKKALNKGLKMDHDRAMAQLSLAATYVAQRKKRLAINMLTEVKKSKSYGMMKDQVKMVEQQMKRI